jgi:CRP-like cAMP-binding protein
MTPVAEGARPQANLDWAESVEGAWKRSPFADVDDPTRAFLMRIASLRSAAAGDQMMVGDTSPQLLLVVEGVIRVFATSSNGRRIAFRYVRAGEITGLITLLAPRPNVEADSLTECTVLGFDESRIRIEAQTNPSLAWALARCAASTAADLMESAWHNVFGSVQTRVSRHLLDMATATPEGLVVRANQWEIADSVGSVRDVVARAIGLLRREGLIARNREGWVILDAAGLHRFADADF